MKPRGPFARRPYLSLETNTTMLTTNKERNRESRLRRAVERIGKAGRGTLMRFANHEGGTRTSTMKAAI